MATTSVIHTAINAMQTQFAALEDLAGVTVVSGDIAGDTPREAVLLTDVDDWEQEWSTTGNLRKTESFTVNGLIGIIKPGAGETVIREARGRAIEIVSAIETYLRQSVAHGDAVDGITLQGTVRRAEFIPRRMTDLIHTDGHLCLVDFGIRLTTSLTKG